ncbi:Adrenodoxin like protein [Cucumispora dikerogammari]|nr:Adrenodoxin like protein [Cucumispora dikerogammari]
MLLPQTSSNKISNKSINNLPNKTIKNIPNRPINNSQNIKVTFKNYPTITHRLQPTEEIHTKNTLPPITLLDLAHKNSIPLEGACEGSLACSTCHIKFLNENTYNLYNTPSDKEYDLLDGAFNPSMFSRLACQIPVDERLNNVFISIPSASKNFYVDGFKPNHH